MTAEPTFKTYRREGGVSTRRPRSAPRRRSSFFIHPDEKNRLADADGRNHTSFMTTQRPDSPPASPPSETTCAAVTVALAVYLVGLVLSIMANTGSGSSSLVTTVKSRLFTPWMVPAWLDLGFDYRLTHGLDDDADHLIEVRRHDGPRSADPLRLPGDRTGEQAARWRRLARATAAISTDADREAILPTAIGTGLFATVGADDVVVRVVRTPVPERGASPLPAQQAASARVRLVDGQPQLLRQVPRGELAPVLSSPAEEASP